MRLFIAINFDESVKKDIQEAINRVKEFSIQGRFVKKEYMHLTLEFLGEVPSDRVSRIKEAMERVTAVPFTMQLDEIGFFKRREGDIYWLGIEESNLLLMLQSQLHKILSDQGFELDDRPYKPHITLGRKVKMGQNFNPKEMLSNISSTKIQVDKIELMKSEQINRNPVYSVIYSKELQ